MSTAEEQLPEPAGASDDASTVAAGEELAEPQAARRVEVGLQRSVRYGRILVGGAVVGALVAALACLFFPVREDIAYIDYTMGQIVGLMAVVGAAIGLLLGGVLAILLNLAARKKHGDAIAVLTDVR